MGKRLLGIALLALTWLPNGWAETIRFKDGSRIQGKVLDQSETTVTVEFQGTTAAYSLADIEAIEGPVTPSSPAASQEAGAAMRQDIGRQKTADEIFREVAPSVVVINTQTPAGAGLGSGFVIDPSGIIATNCHVVIGAENIQVKLKDGQVFPATRLRGADFALDVCLLTIEAQPLLAVTLGDLRETVIGDRVFVIGAPLGFEYSISDGLFSGRRRQPGSVETLQFSAPVSPGNSGGPLLDAHGRVIGVVSMMVIGGQNLNFAMPVNAIRQVLNTRHAVTLAALNSSMLPAYQFRQQALDALAVGNKAKAIQLLQEAVQASPGLDDGWNDLCALHYDQQLYEQASRECERALELNPGSITAHINLGNIACDKGKLHDAIAEFDQAVQLDDMSKEPHKNLAVCYQRWKRYDDAIGAFQKVLAIVPDDLASVNDIGNLYRKQGNLDEAERWIQKALVLDPKSPVVHVNAGLVRFKRGLRTDAMREYEQALSLFPDYGLAHLLLAQVYYQAGENKEAVRHLRRAEKLGFPREDPEWLNITVQLQQVLR